MNPACPYFCKLDFRVGFFFGFFASARTMVIRPFLPNVQILRAQQRKRNKRGEIHSKHRCSFFRKALCLSSSFFFFSQLLPKAVDAHTLCDASWLQRNPVGRAVVTEDKAASAAVVLPVEKCKGCVALVACQNNIVLLPSYVAGIGCCRNGC